MNVGKIERRAEKRKLRVREGKKLDGPKAVGALLCVKTHSHIGKNSLKLLIMESDILHGKQRCKFPLPSALIRNTSILASLFYLGLRCEDRKTMIQIQQLSWNGRMAKKTTICPGLTPLRVCGERRFTLARAWVILFQRAAWVLAPHAAWGEARPELARSGP